MEKHSKSDSHRNASGSQIELAHNHALHPVLLNGRLVRVAVQSNHAGGVVVKQKGIIYCLLVLMPIILFGCQPDTSALDKGKQPPAFELESLNGELLRYPDLYEGKVVVIRFWADWCPFCKSEMQNIEPIYRKLKDKGLVMLALNVRQDRETAAAFINKLAITYEVLLDEQGETARNYGVIGLPTTFILDRKGRLHTRIIGESTAELFEMVVSELL